MADSLPNYQKSGKDSAPATPEFFLEEARRMKRRADEVANLAAGMDAWVMEQFDCIAGHAQRIIKIIEDFKRKEG